MRETHDCEVIVPVPDGSPEKVTVEIWAWHTENAQPSFPIFHQESSRASVINQQHSGK